MGEERKNLSGREANTTCDPHLPDRPVLPLGVCRIWHLLRLSGLVAEASSGRSLSLSG
jgi:hypothetical protein